MDYVDHVRSLGAKYLFPNCQWDSPTLQRDPSKNASRAFGDHLDKVKIEIPVDNDPAATAPAQPRKPRTVDEALDQVFSGVV